jgi:CheY-like chemotaxis protein
MKEAHHAPNSDPRKTTYTLSFWLSAKPSCLPPLTRNKPQAFCERSDIAPATPHVRSPEPVAVPAMPKFFPDEEPTPPPEAPPVARRHRILIVEDSRTTRQVIRRDLQDDDYELVEANDGLEALALIRNGYIPDLITLDLDMPRLGGFATCERLYGPEFSEIFGHSPGQRVPVIFITASDRISDRRRGFELGALDFLPKDFEPGQLTRIVDRILRPSQRLSGVTALVVDDSPTVCQVIANGLREEGAEVLEALDSHSALEIICNRLTQIDIVVTDLVMPGIDGAELCRRIRRELGLTDLPVLFLTGSTDQTRRLEAFRAGATDCLPKPFIKEEMAARLIAYTERYRFERRLRKLLRDKQTALDFKQTTIAALSHDMRTPLNAILGFADLLCENPRLDNVGRENAVLIGESGRMLLNLTDGLLRDSQAEAQNAPAELINLAEVANKSIRVLRPLAERKKITLTWENRAPRHIIAGREEELLRVFNNLIGNAIKFTPSGGRIQIIMRDSAPGQIVVAFCDNGVGIAPDKVPRLFDRFTDTSRRGTNQEASTGLGLSIVKEIVTRCGGKIEVHSVIDRGTEFRLNFPLPTTTPPIPLPEKSFPSAEILSASLKGLRLLVAEDNAVNRRLLEALLTQAGTQPTFVEDGIGAVAALRTDPDRYSAVLMDIEMPHLDGYAATRLIRQAGRSELPILAMTAHRTETVLQACLDAGMNGVITKPFKVPELARTLSPFAITA